MESDDPYGVSTSRRTGALIRWCAAAVTQGMVSVGSWRLHAARLWARPEVRWLAAIAALAVVLRIVWVLYAARLPQGLHDPTLYYFFGNRIAQGRGYTDLEGLPSAYFPIGYPAALGGVFALVLHTPIPDNLIRAGAFFNVFVGVATIPLAYYVARRLFSPTVGLLAALWLAVFPNLIFHTAAFLSETLFNFLVMAALAVLVSSGWRQGRVDRGRLLAFGVLLGLSVLVRPISLLFLPLLLAVWLWAGAGWRRALAQTGLALATAVAVIAPWSIRNFVVMDSPIVISANLGDDLCIGHHPGAQGHFVLADYCFAGYRQLKRPEFEVRRNDENIEKAVRYAVHHPGRELQLIVKRARWLWDHDHDGLFAVESYREDRFIEPAVKTVLVRTTDTFFFVTMALAGLGLVAFIAPPRDPRRLFFLLALLALAGIPLAFFGEARFHVPAVPLAVVSAAWLVAQAQRVSPLVARVLAAAGVWRAPDTRR